MLVDGELDEDENTLRVIVIISDYSLDIKVHFEEKIVIF